jgi:hypothetical protein
MSRCVAPRQHGPSSLKVAAIACMIAGGCSRDAPLVSPSFESPETAVVVSSVTLAKAKDRPVDDAVAAVLERLVPAFADYGIPFRTPLLALQSRPNDRAAWDALLRNLETTKATLPQEYRPDLDALRLELDAIAPR